MHVSCRGFVLERVPVSRLWCSCLSCNVWSVMPMFLRAWIYSWILRGKINYDARSLCKLILAQLLCRGFKVKLRRGSINVSYLVSAKYPRLRAEALGRRANTPDKSVISCQTLAPGIVHTSLGPLETTDNSIEGLTKTCYFEGLFVRQ